MGASKLVLHYKSQHRTGHTRGKGPGSVTFSQLFHGPAPRSPARFKLVIGNSLGAKVGIICRHTRGRAHELAPGRELVPASVAGSASCAWPKAFDEAHIAQHASPSMSSIDHLSTVLFAWAYGLHRAAGEHASPGRVGQGVSEYRQCPNLKAMGVECMQLKDPF